MKTTQPLFLIQLQHRLSSEKAALTEQLAQWLVLGKIIDSNGRLEKVEGERMEQVDLETFKDELNQTNWQEALPVTYFYHAEKVEASLTCVDNRFTQRFLLKKVDFYKEAFLIEDYLQKQLANNGIQAFIRPYEEYLSSNIADLSLRDSFDLSHQSLRLMRNDEQEKIVDCSLLPGYDVVTPQRLYTSCWKMWYTTEYFQDIPKQAFLDVQAVHNVTACDDGTLIITLYKDPLSWSHPYNIKSQQLFRFQLGFDQFMNNNGVGLLRDPYTEFMQFKNQRQMLQYQNRYLQPCPKKDAKHFTLRIFDSARGFYQEARHFGQLNVYAFFPFLEAKQERAVAYHQIVPDFTLDEALSVYKYYIQYYLEVYDILETKSTQELVLIFYIPEANQLTLPIEALQRLLAKKDLRWVRELAPYEYTVISHQKQLKVHFRPSHQFETDQLLWTLPTEKTSKEPEIKKNWLERLSEALNNNKTRS